jgi:hypothetical protein
VAFKIIFCPGPSRGVKVIFPPLLFTVKSLPVLKLIVPVTKVMSYPPEETVVKAPEVKLKLVPAV